MTNIKALPGMYLLTRAQVRNRVPFDRHYLGGITVPVCEFTSSDSFVRSIGVDDPSVVGMEFRPEDSPPQRLFFGGRVGSLGSMLQMRVEDLSRSTLNDADLDLVFLSESLRIPGSANIIYRPDSALFSGYAATIKEQDISIPHPCYFNQLPN